MPIKGPDVHHNNDGTVNLNYKPIESGTHELALTYNDQIVEGEYHF